MFSTFSFPRGPRRALVVDQKTRAHLFSGPVIGDVPLFSVLVQKAEGWLGLEIVRAFMVVGFEEGVILVRELNNTFESGEASPI